MWASAPGGTRPVGTTAGDWWAVFPGGRWTVGWRSVILMLMMGRKPRSRRMLVALWRTMMRAVTVRSGVIATGISVLVFHVTMPADQNRL